MTDMRLELTTFCSAVVLFICLPNVQLGVACAVTVFVL